MSIKFINSDFSFSIFKNLFSNEKYQNDIDVNQLIELIKYGTFRKEIEELRSSGSRAEGDRIKKENLPAVTLSGSFNKRSREGLIRHSGLIQIDIDKVDNYDDLFQKLCNDPFTYLCFRSPRGKGIKVVVKINPSADTHLEQFNALQKYYNDTYKTEIDKSCKDIARCMLASWDPDLFCNPYSEVFAEMYSEEKQKSTSQPQKPGSPEKIKIHSDSLLETIDAIVRELESGKIDLTTNYDDWVKIGFSLVSSLGANGRSYFHRISKMFPEYSYKETDKKYNQLLDSKGKGVGIGTLIWMAKNHGIETIRHHEPEPKMYEYTENICIAAEEKSGYNPTALKNTRKENKPPDSPEELKVLLKKFRLDIAKKENITAFRVFYDSTLDELVKSKPQAVRDLYNIKGLGDKKIKWFGQEIVSIIKSIN